MYEKEISPGEKLSVTLNILPLMVVVTHLHYCNTYFKYYYLIFYYANQIIDYFPYKIALETNKFTLLFATLVFLHMANICFLF